MKKQPGPKEKASGAPRPDYYFLVRTYTGGEPVAHVWLMDHDGAAHFSLLSGEVLADRAEALVTHMESRGFRVERDHSPLPGVSMYRPRAVANSRTPDKQGFGF